MRNLIVALAAGVVGMGMAVSAQAAPSSSLAPLTTLSQSGIEQAQYHRHHHKKCHKVRHCYWKHYKRHCHYVTRCH